MARSYYFPDGIEAKVDLTIQEVGGRKLYRLHCRPDSYEPGDPGPFTGEFDCHLHSLYSDDPYESLLIEDPLDSVEIHSSRGAFLASELEGACGKLADWGAIRTFRVRGMRIRLEISDLRIGKSHGEGISTSFDSFRFAVGVQPDPSALSAIAEPSPYAPPWRLSADGKAVTWPCEAVDRHVPGEVTPRYVEKKGLAEAFVSIPAASTTITIRARSVPVGFQWADEPIPPDERFVDVPIPESSGAVAYEFECSAYNVPGEIGKIDRYGLSCGLFKAGNRTNLLQDAVDPYSRMSMTQVLPNQLKGRCAAYPQWGATRVFRLRGFAMTLSFTNPVFAASDFSWGALQQVDLRVSIVPDAHATSPVALPPKYIYWGFLPSPHACQNVLTRAED